MKFEDLIFFFFFRVEWIYTRIWLIRDRISDTSTRWSTDGFILRVKNVRNA